MTLLYDHDRFFLGKIDASLPACSLEEGVISRLINGRFVQGSITNALGFDEIVPKYLGDVNPLIPHELLLRSGELQLFAPLSTIDGDYLIAVISGVIFRINVNDLDAQDITPPNSMLRNISSRVYPLSYIDNSGGVYGMGGYLVIFNYPNLPILIDKDRARLSNPYAYEVPPARFGTTCSNRAFVVSAENLLYASDPLGGASTSVPLTFNEVLNPSSAYYGQIFSIGSALDSDRVTGMARVVRLLDPAQEFLGQYLAVSTETTRYFMPVAEARDTWDISSFVLYAGTTEGIAGNLAIANIGTSVVYTASTGRIKTFQQDQERESSLAEKYFDDPMGQYLNHCESEFYFRNWYRDLDHSRSIIKYSKDRFYATVYPFTPSFIDKYGVRHKNSPSPSFRALAVGSLDSTSQIGAVSNIGWECFLDWLNPAGLAMLGNKLYIATKDEYGGIKFYKENNTKTDEHDTIIYTRGYTFKGNSTTSYEGDYRARSLSELSLYFRQLGGAITIDIYCLVNSKWVLVNTCNTSKQSVNMPIGLRQNCTTDSGEIRLRIDIKHKGIPFELSRIGVIGEAYTDGYK